MPRQPRPNRGLSKATYDWLSAMVAKTHRDRQEAIDAATLFAQDLAQANSGFFPSRFITAVKEQHDTHWKAATLPRVQSPDNADLIQIKICATEVNEIRSVLNDKQACVVTHTVTTIEPKDASLEDVLAYIEHYAQVDPDEALKEDFGGSPPWVLERDGIEIEGDTLKDLTHAVLGYLHDCGMNILGTKEYVWE